MRRGLSAVEVVAVIIIISTLLSLILAGVQLTRENARKLQCQNNLRQTGFALQSTMGLRKEIPHLGSERIKESITSRTLVVGNCFVTLLSELDVMFWASDGKILVNENANTESLPPGVFCCPSASPRLGYRLNVDAGNHNPFLLSRTNEGRRVFRRTGPGTKLNAITDGLSQTVAISERHSDDDVAPQKPTAVAISNSSYTILGLTEACDAALTRGDAISNSGAKWWSSDPVECGYVHWRVPNDRRVDCDASLSGQKDAKYLAIASRSRHGGGVQSSFLDASVHWINSDIDPGVWASFGSPSSGD